MGGTDAASGGNSSGEEDGDADWKAAINSVASVDFGLSATNGRSKPKPAIADSSGEDDETHDLHRSRPKLKLYQIKAQKMLDELVERSLVMVDEPIPHSTSNDIQSNEGLIRLFKNAPPGIELYPDVETHLLPCKKPRIVPGEEINEKSKEFKCHIRSVAVDGTTIIAAARKTFEKSFARQKARETAKQAAAKREEERILELKRIRGEKWLPSIAKYMKDGGLSKR